VKEFDAIFDNFLKQIPKELAPTKETFLLLYINAFEGEFGFILKEQMAEILTKEMEYLARIEENLLSSKIKPFQFP